MLNKIRLIKKGLFKPVLFKIILDDYFKLTNKTHSNSFHLKKAIDWLTFAQQISKDGGVSKGYSLMEGWENSYMETSGYIIRTFFDYYKMTNNNNYLKICRKIADWECSIQLKDGGFSGGVVGKINPPGIFITGQVLLGLIRAFTFTNNDAYLSHAIKAGNFIIENQEKNGAWIKFCYKHSPEAFNTRSAWALLELFKITNDLKYKNAAIKNLKWARTQQNVNFWFNNNDTINIEYPYLHFLSYTIRGFLESGLILENKDFINLSLNCSKRLIDYFEREKRLPARFNSKWKSYDKFSCLTGNAQISIIWLKLYEIFKDKRFLTNAIELNNYLKSKQMNFILFRFIDGAIKGSDPIWGEYSPFRFPNWATKFFCDALMLEKNILKNNKK